MFNRYRCVKVISEVVIVVVVVGGGGGVCVGG